LPSYLLDDVSYPLKFCGMIVHRRWGLDEKPSERRIAANNKVVGSAG